MANFTQISGEEGYTLSNLDVKIDSLNNFLFVDSYGNIVTKSISFDDTKVTNTLNNTAKAYLTGTTSANTNTGTQVFDDNIYVDTVPGRLRVLSLLIGNNSLLSYDSNKSALKISFV